MVLERKSESARDVYHDVAKEWEIRRTASWDCAWDRRSQDGGNMEIAMKHFGWNNLDSNVRVKTDA